MAKMVERLRVKGKGYAKTVRERVEQVREVGLAVRPARPSLFSASHGPLSWAFGAREEGVSTVRRRLSDVHNFRESS